MTIKKVIGESTVINKPTTYNNNTYVFGSDSITINAPIIENEILVLCGSTIRINAPIDAKGGLCIMADTVIINADVHTETLSFVGNILNINKATLSVDTEAGLFVHQYVNLNNKGLIKAEHIYADENYVRAIPHTLDVDFVNVKEMVENSQSTELDFIDEFLADGACMLGIISIGWQYDLFDA